MLRSFAENFGLNWPKNWAYMIDRKPVTWNEVLEKRRQRQKIHLETIRKSEPEIVPCYVWTFFIPLWFRYGWHCYIVTRKKSFGVGIERNPTLALNLMSKIPLGILPNETFFNQWMESFANAYPRKKHPKDKRKAGVLIGWFDHKLQKFSLQKPTKGAT